MDDRQFHKLLRRLDWLSFKQDLILKLEIAIMSTMSDLVSEVAAESTVVDSAIALLSGLAAQVAALQPNQAAIDALAASITSQTTALSNAVTANTPAKP